MKMMKKVSLKEIDEYIIESYRAGKRRREIFRGIIEKFEVHIGMAHITRVRKKLTENGEMRIFQKKY